MIKSFFKNDKFTVKIFFRLFSPAMLSAFGWALSDMADAVVVGQRLGSVGLAAIALILPIYMINCAIVHGFGLGGSVQYSKLLGEGDIDRAKENFTSVTFAAMLLSVLTAVFGLVFIEPLLKILGTVKTDGALYAATYDYLKVLLPATPLFYLSNLLNYYLRNDENQKIAGIGSVTGNIADICLNIVFVLFLNLGTFGAALSTALGQIISILIYAAAFFTKANNLKIRLYVKGFLKDAVSCFKSGGSVSVQYLYQLVFLLICNNVLIRMSGEGGVAIFDLIQNTSYLILYLYEGVSRAMQPLLSTYQGENNLLGKKVAGRVGFMSGISVGVLLIAFIQIFPGVMTSLFGINEPSMITSAHIALRIYSFSAFFAGLNTLICNYYQACEQEGAPFVISTLRGAAILIPVTLIFSVGSLDNFWFIFPISEILTFVLFVLLRKKFPIPNLEEKRVFQKMIRTTEQNIGNVSIEVGEFCEKFEATIKQQYFISMTVEELAMAILNKGLAGTKDGYILISVLAFPNGKFEIHLRDNAVTFNPFELEHSGALNDSTDFNAVGISVIKSKAEEFFYRRYQGFNYLVLKI